MTKILALDSSTDACSVALHIDGEVIHIFELAAKSHTQRLLPMVDEILQQAQCGLRDLDAIAYGCGPGSFTGLRICMGVVQGLAFGSNLSVIPVSTLQAMARGFVSQLPHQNLSVVDNNLPLLVTLDARMEEVYWGLFSADAIPQALDDEYVMKPGLVCEHKLVAALQKNFIAIGPGWHYADLGSIVPATLMLDAHPNAKDIAAVAVDIFNNNGQISIMDAELVYLRNSISWQKRQRIRSLPLTNL
ncbi:MAG: tRNA (adenosine(37)-N6)-threonylcarbamoyltransferase complex dimerization subunit type 1 TsaB [Pseudomonadota bacterium]